MFEYIFQDWIVNKGNVKFQLILMLFRTSQLARKSILFPLFIPYLICYRILIEWIFGVELPWGLSVERGLAVFHGQGLVVNDKCIIGRGCTLRNGVTIGNKIGRDGRLTSAPVLGDFVDIGANAVIIGSVTIGSNVYIGAGSVVVKDVPDNCIVAGNPAKVIRNI